MVSGIQELAASSEFIFSTVTVASAKAVAEETAKFLGKRHIYVDMNSTSPHAQQNILKIINRSDADFVDAALMGAKSFFGHKIPILAAGKGAKGFQSKMSRYGMNIRCIHGEPGKASGVKMLQSVYMKGIEALLLETLAAAYRHDILDFVLESIVESMEKKTFMETVNTLITTNAVHSERRADEMREVATTLREIKIEPVMSEATKSILLWSAGLNLREYFKGSTPDKYTDVLAAIDKKTK